MVLSQPEKQRQFEQLLAHKHNVLNSIEKISSILKHDFPEHYDIAYQHWIPQILTALDNYEKLLPRGNYNMRYTINNILEADNGKTT